MITATNSAIFPQNHKPSGSIDNVQARSIGSIREIDNLFTQNAYVAQGDIDEIYNDVRYFTVADYSMSNEKDGAFKYSIKIDIEDGSIVYLRELSNLLNSGLNALEVYYKDFTENNASDPSSPFANADYYKNGLGPWVWALKDLIKTIRSFADDGAELIGDLEEKLYILTSPATATRESLSKVIDTYRSVDYMIRKISDEFPTKGKRPPENMDPKTVSTGNRISLPMVTVEHSFTELYHIKDNGDSGYDYFTSARATTPGLFVLDSDAFSARMKHETLKYFRREARDDENVGLSPMEFSYLTPTTLKLKDENFKTYAYRIENDTIINNTELGNFNALTSLFNYKKYGEVIKDNSQTSTETERSRINNPGDENLFSQNLNPLALLVKNNLSAVMSDVNVVALKKYESSCFNNTEKEEAEYAKLMMPTSTSNKYTSEISSKDIRDSHVHEETGPLLNPSFILAPLFYMQLLNITKDIFYLTKNLSAANAEIEGLPNQIKAMAYSYGSTKLTAHQWYDDGVFSLKELKNAAFYYLNSKNLVAVEVYIGHRGEMINDPAWVELKTAHLNMAAQSGNTSLLCRLRHYINEDLGFVQDELLNLNIFDQCFLLDAASIAETILPGELAARNTRALDRMSTLDNNDLLKVNSAFMRSNLKFGPVVKQIVSNEKIRQSGQQAPQRSATTVSTARPTQTTTMTSPRGGGTGGGY